MPEVVDQTVGWGRFPEAPTLGPLHSVEIRNQPVPGGGTLRIAVAACGASRLTVVMPLRRTPPANTGLLGVCFGCVTAIATKSRVRAAA